MNDHNLQCATTLVFAGELTAPKSLLGRAAHRGVYQTGKTDVPGTSRFVFHTMHAFYAYMLCTQLNYYLCFYRNL